MIKVDKLLVPVFIFYGLKLVFDYLCDHKLLNFVRRDIIYFVSEWILVAFLMYFIFRYSTKVQSKVISIAFSIVIVVRILLNLVCWNCSKDEYFNLVINPTVDKIMWLPVAVVLTIGIIAVKWQSLSKLGKYGSR